MSANDDVVKERKIPRRRFVGSKKLDGKGSIVTKKTFGTDSNKEVVFKPRNKTPASYRSITHIPDEILEDEDLNEAIKCLKVY